MKKTAISIVLMFVCFIISGLFFLSSGVIDSDTAEIDKSHTKQILHELNRIPFIHMDVDDINLDNDEYRTTTLGGVKKRMNNTSNAILGLIG